MDITIFIGLFVYVIVIRVIVHRIRYHKKQRLAAFLISTASAFVEPMVLMWYINFLFGVIFNYWSLFGALIVLDLFTTRIEEKDIVWEDDTK